MIRLLGDRVLVALPPKKDAEAQDAATGYTYRTTGEASGIVLAKPPDLYDVEVATRGIVVALGEKKGVVDLDDARADVHEYFLAVNLDSGPKRLFADHVDRVLMAMQPAPFEVQIDDCVVFSPSAGNQFELGEVTYVILRESEILGIVESANGERT